VIKSSLVQAVKIVGGFAKNEILSALDDLIAKDLIKKTESQDKAEVVMAKVKLKEKYPEVYKVLNEA
jgi:hydroxylamine reductase (hybrid-cluster protein)